MTETALRRDLLLYEKTACSGFLSVNYRLWASTDTLHPDFCVTVSTDQDECTAPLGTDLLWATEIFRILSQGLVTPCTLFDVLKDLLFTQSR